MPRCRIAVRQCRLVFSILISSAGNAVTASGDYRLEPLVVIRTLDRLDKTKYEDDEKSEAAEVCSEFAQ